MLSAVVLSQSTRSSSRAAKPSVPLEGGTGDRKLICDRPFAALLRICISLGAPSPICAVYCKFQREDKQASSLVVSFGKALNGIADCFYL